MNLNQIITEGRTALYTNNNGYKDLAQKKRIHIFFDILPLCVFVLPYLGNELSKHKDLVGYGLTFVSIFAGLMFSLIVVIADKAKIRKISLEKLTKTDHNEEDVNSLKRYLIFSSKTISQIAYTIMICMVLIMIVLCHQLSLENIDFLKSPQVIKVKQIVKYILSGAVYYLGLQFIIMVFAIISRMYSFLIIESKSN